MGQNALNSLTKLERKILDHRLGVPDCIADALAESYHADDVCDVADLLLRGDYDGACAINQRIAHEVLADAVEGGTWNANIDEYSPQKQAGKLRASDSLAAKIGRLVGRHLRYPNH